MIIVNGWKPLTIITKRYILNVAAVLDPLLRVFICLVGQIFIASAGQLSKCYRKSTVIAFRILVKSHKLVSKFTGKNL